MEKHSITVAVGPLASVAGFAPALCGLKNRLPGLLEDTDREKVGRKVQALGGRNAAVAEEQAPGPRYLAR